MKVDIKNVDQIVRHMTVVIDKETYEKDYQKAFNKFSRKVVVDGFRKGKAPVSVIKRMYSDNINAYYIDEFMNEYYRYGLNNSDLRPVSQGSFHDVEFNEEGEATFIFEFETLPEGFEYEYKGLEVQFKPDVYTDFLLDETIKVLLKENAEEIPFDEKDTIEIGDKIKLSDVASQEELKEFYVNEETFRDNVYADINSVLGLKINDVFSTDEQTLKVIDAFKIVMPELNDETAKILGHESVDDLKKVLKENITNDIEKRNKNRLNFAIADAFGQRNIDNIKIPKEYLKTVGRRMLMQYMGNQMNEEMFDNLEDEFLFNIAERQLPSIIWDVAFEQIAKDHNIEVDDGDVQNEISRYANEFKIDEEDIRTKFADNLENLKIDILSKKVLDFIHPFCVIKEADINASDDGVSEAEYEVVEEETTDKE